MGRRSVMHSRDFSLLWAGQLLSMTGWQATLVAFPLLVLALTHSAGEAGLVGALGYLTFFVYLPAGALADRVDRKKLMIYASLAEGACLVLVPLSVVIRPVALLIIATMALVQGAAVEVFGVAEQAALIHIVSEGRLEGAVAQNQARNKLALLAGPVIGGSLFAVGSGVPFLAAGALSVIGALSVMAMTGRMQEDRLSNRGKEPAWHEITDGMRWIWSEPFFRSASLACAASNVMSGAIDLVLIVRAKEDHASSAAIGIMIGLMGVGGVIGALMAGRLRGFFTLPHLLKTVFISQTIVLPCLLLTKNAYLLGIIVLFAFLGGASINSALIGARMRRAPDYLRGRISAANGLVVNAALPFGVLAIGYILNATNSTTGLLVLIGWQACLATWICVSPSARKEPADVVVSHFVD